MSIRLPAPEVALNIAVLVHGPFMNGQYFQRVRGSNYQTGTPPSSA